MTFYLIMSCCQRWLLTLLLLQCLILVCACPSSCKCMWKGGKQTVECINENLITIPDGVDQGTQVLEFSGNNLQMLPRERFQRMGLLNLQRIYLAKCRISQIDDRAFRGLTNLVELDLSDNLLNSVPTETFSDYQSLMRLTVSGNPIQILKTHSFIHLSFLTTLELSNCQIEVIEPDAFSGLDNLEWLKLDGNRLNNIRGAKTLPDSLHEIYLHHNPWQCDCRLMELHSWLINYNIPHPVEPLCAAPPRLKDNTIKSLDLGDLACLPDVSPTTLYLEIAEGKNVSLLCRVSAVPEARVSWWFQGRILQNDSMVAPGLHLYYFVEEGTEEKRSELFIFNTNTEDNGTFVCTAENPAGKSHSNYTIRIVVKEEPVIGVTTFPYEYVITITAASSVLALFVIIAIIICVVRCRRKRQRRRKKERSKVVALHHQQLHQGKSPDDGVNQITRLGADIPTAPAKVNGTVVMSERHQRDVMIVATGSVSTSLGKEVTRPGLPNNPYGSPHSLRSFPLEQNPDLINDTESVGKERRPSIRRLDGDGVVEDVDRENSGHNSYQEAMENIIHDYETSKTGIVPSTTSNHQWREVEPQYPIHMSTLPRGASASRDLYQHHHTADVHLSPGRFLDSDGYPIDYGLPKIPTHLPIHSTLVPETPAAFYRTLPHNRSSRLDATGVATPSGRYSREAEFLSRSTQPPSYEHYSPSDVRYTVEGYPCAQPQTMYSVEPHGSFPDNTYLPSPPAPYKGEPTIPPASSSEGRASPTLTQSWQDGSRNHQGHSSGSVSNCNSCQDHGPTSSQCCVGSQTSNGEDNVPFDVSKDNVKDDSLANKGQQSQRCAGNNNNNQQQQQQQQQQHAGALTESPDEGYEGEGLEGTEI